MTHEKDETLLLTVSKGLEGGVLNSEPVLLGVRCLGPGTTQKLYS